MKFTVSTAELKNVLDLVKVVADQSEGSKVVAHSVCLFRAYPKTKELKLDFALNGSFLTYEFSDVTIGGKADSDEVRRSIDMSVMSGLKFTGKEVTIEILTKKNENTLAFSSGSLKGKILVASSEIEEQVEEARPKDGSVDLTHTFVVKDWMRVLGSHMYGSHHNAADADKRPVLVRSKDGTLVFDSSDKVSRAHSTLNSKHPMASAIEFRLSPKPLKAILSVLSKDTDGDFNFGVSKEFWRLHHGKIDVWFPSLTQTAKIEQDELVAKIKTSPSYMMKFPAAVIKECITELAPVLSATSGKDDLPLVTLNVSKDKQASFTINTTKAKDVRRELVGAEFMEDRIPLEENQDICINFNFLREFVSALTASAESAEPVIIMKWWPYQSPDAPVKGKIICLESDNNMFAVARVREQKTTV